MINANVIEANSQNSYKPGFFNLNRIDNWNKLPPKEFLLFPQQSSPQLPLVSKHRDKKHSLI